MQLNVTMIRYNVVASEMAASLESTSCLQNYTCIINNIQKDLLVASNHICTIEDISVESKLTTGNSGIIRIKTTATHCSPSPIQVYL